MNVGAKGLVACLVAASLAAAIYVLVGLHDVIATPPGRQASGADAAADREVGGVPDVSVLLRTADPAHGARIFGQCAACHSIGRGGPDLDGPNLYGVLGGPVGRRRSRYAYTAALRQTGGIWDFGRMDAWLAHPRKVVPSTSMSFAGLPDARDRADVIAYINAQGSNLPIP
ncbi:c-type cytochrome [Lichenifustis flavocetrariae]|uniref:C-type cytochrome n=1 Tax=Lichenifustis flavocetrariae TaxID=2949735 RepID=A0AA41Z486_9HYPH|nr:c-type cytochrome [Lichenifustis flavocetrariae]MCW6508952.1 c-type cytochrome [Lichenifustis flavocetrariae]